MPKLGAWVPFRYLQAQVGRSTTRAGSRPRWRPSRAGPDRGSGPLPLLDQRRADQVVAHPPTKVTGAPSWTRPAAWGRQRRPAPAGAPTLRRAIPASRNGVTSPPCPSPSGQSQPCRFRRQLALLRRRKGSGRGAWPRPPLPLSSSASPRPTPGRRASPQHPESTRPHAHDHHRGVTRGKEVHRHRRLGGSGAPRSQSGGHRTRYEVVRTRRGRHLTCS